MIRLHKTKPLQNLSWLGLAIVGLSLSACSDSDPDGDSGGRSSTTELEGWIDILDDATFDLEETLDAHWLAAAQALLSEGRSSEPSELRQAARELAAGPLSASKPLPSIEPTPADTFSPQPNDDLEPPPWGFPEEGWPFIPGELVIRLDEATEPVEERVASLHEHEGLEGYRFSPAAYASPDLLSVRIQDVEDPTRPIDFDETLEVGERLVEHPRLRYAHPNYLRRIYAAPNDAFYSYQWPLRQLQMEAAWEITTGSPDVVVAVIDTGTTIHEDLPASRLLPGYDMVAHPRLAGDGDGRDPDPSPVPGRGWHGQHVAGVIAATANNGIGIVGIDWNAMVLPIRGIGLMGWGSSLDIIAAIRWASGSSVPNVPDNANPADIINLSLGGGPLVESEEEAIHDAVRAGSLVVAASGNEAVDASNSSYAGYLNVLSVGAVDLSGRRAPYSNFGRAIDLMAPGGNMNQDYDRDGNRDGVLSTYFDSTGRRYSYQLSQGTSMAAPHVSAVAALVKSLKPELGPVEIKHVLVSTASPGAQCNEGCGSGLLNPVKALQQISGETPTTPRLAVSATRIDLGRRLEGRLIVSNTGGGELSWEASLAGEHHQRFELSASSGKLGAGDTSAIEVKADAEGLSDGQYLATLRIEGANSRLTVDLSFTVRENLPDIGKVIVGLVSFDEDQPVVGASFETGVEDDYSYRLPILEGSWYVLAVADANGDGQISRGDWIGVWQNWDFPGEIRPETGSSSFFDFGLHRYQPKAASVGQLGDACIPGPACQAPNFCVSNVPSGFCTRTCRSHGDCGGGVCVETGENAHCFAECNPAQGCSNDELECQQIAPQIAVCVPVSP